MQIFCETERELGDATTGTLAVRPLRASGGRPPHSKSLRRMISDVSPSAEIIAAYGMATAPTYLPTAQDRDVCPARAATPWLPARGGGF